MPKMPEMPDNKLPPDKKKELAKVLAKMAKKLLERKEQ